MSKTVGLFGSGKVGDRFSGTVAGHRVCGKITRVQSDNSIEVADEITGKNACIRPEAIIQ